jgi:capsular exopolysaccharide synthesis family protein
LANQLADLKAKVEDSQAKVTEYQRASGLAGITMATSSAGERPGGSEIPTTSSNSVPEERLLELNRDLTNAEVSRIAKEAVYKMVATQDPDVVLGIGDSPLASSLGSDSVLSPGSSDLTLLQQLRQQQAQLQVQLASASTKYGARNPAIVQLRNEENTLNGQIHAELERIRVRAKNDLDMATLAEDGIRKREADQEQEVNKVSAKADQLLLLQEEALSNRELYQDLYTKLEEASVAAGIRASNITLVNPARYPARPSSPKRIRSIGLGGAFGLLFGLITAFSWDYFDDSITSPEQVRQITTIPVIGIIPDFEQKQNTAGKYGSSAKIQQPQESVSQAWLLRAPRSHISEAYRTFRTALLMSRAEHPPKMMLVMSGSPEEGKSTTCFNTAVAFAVQGDRVLYLDADLRRARAHLLFSHSNDVGLSNCLTSGITYQEVIKPHPDIDTLSLLPAGPIPPNPSELIGSKRFVDLLAELRKDFDYVFIDSPPVLLVTDAQLISSLVDGFVLVTRSNKTTKRLLRRSLELMHTPKASALGIVVNAMDVKSAAYSGYGYYGGGSNYYVEEKK